VYASAVRPTESISVSVNVITVVEANGDSVVRLNNLVRFILKPILEGCERQSLPVTLKVLLYVIHKFL